MTACADNAPLPTNTQAPTLRPRATLTATAPAMATLFPSLTPPPLKNRTPEPTATPAPVLRQLTTGGCCVQPSFAPDGSQVWYIDKPGDSVPAGLWGVPVTGGTPAFVTDKLGVFSADGALRAYPQAGETLIERLATGETWHVPAGGRAIQFAPNGAQIAWQTASSAINFDTRLVEIWAAGVDGHEARVVARRVGGGLAGWFPDSAHLLVTGRPTTGGEAQVTIVNIADGAAEDWLPAADKRGLALSPAGGWLAYQVTFSGDAAQDGLWVTDRASPPRRLPLFGAYRWQSEGRLLIIPLEATGGSQRVAVYDAAADTLKSLTDPLITAFRIAAGDWALSPDGQRIVFVSAADHNLWLLELP